MKGFPGFVALVSFCSTGMGLSQFALKSINIGGGEFSSRSRREEALINFRSSSQSLMKQYGQDAKKCLYELNRWLDF